MTENKAKTYSLLIKIGIGLILCVFAVILLSQYITLNNLNSQNDKLNQEYATLVQQDTDLTDKKTEIQDNYDEYVADVARDQYNLTEDDEILINKK